MTNETYIFVVGIRNHIWFFIRYVRNKSVFVLLWSYSTFGYVFSHNGTCIIDNLSLFIFGRGAIGQKLAFTLAMHCCNYATQNIIPLEGKAENVSIKDIMHPNFIFIIAAETSMM